MINDPFIPWRALVPAELLLPNQSSLSMPDVELFYANQQNTDSLRFIDISMVSHYFTDGDIEDCKKTIREFWDNVKKRVITPEQCNLIDKKCCAILTAIYHTFEQSSQNLKIKYSIVDIKAMQDQLDHARASHTAVKYFELNDDEDLSLHDYFILRCHILCLVFIHHLLRLRVKLTIADVEHEILSTDQNSSFKDLPTISSLTTSLKTPSPLESLIEDQWILKPLDAKRFVVQYPTFEGMDLIKMEKNYKKSVASWKEFNGSRGG